MKKIISIILAITCLYGFSITSYAANAKLTADNVSISAGESFEITYSIKNNPGIMGFAFELSYDSSALAVVSVTKSESIKSGIFNDSVGTSEPGTVKIVWTGTENFYDDISLFIVKFKANDEASGKYSVKIKCLQDDTFNEKWQDVKIDCDQVSVQVGSDSQPTLWERLIAFINKVISFIKSLIK